MSEPKPWDLVVIGGGTGGLVASRTAASFGASVLLIEGDRLGGDCLWTGCVPSKSLIAAASAAKAARSSAHLGIRTTGVEVDFPAVMRHVHSAMHEIAPIDSPEALARDGVEVLMGYARFTGARSLEVDGRRIDFRQALIASGGSPSVPDVTGVGEVDVLTSETFWELRSLPAKLVVLGGGAIGCEIAQAMARLGSKVTLIHRGARLLAKEDERAGAIVRAALEADGVTVLTDRSLTALSSRDRRSGAATLDDGSVVPFHAILAAVGRTPNSRSLDVDAAGVDLDDRGNIVVDDRLRTTNRRIWAAGDVTGLPQFTHTAGVNGSLAATNAMLGLARTIDRAAVPRVTFTHPEVGAVGVSPADAASAGLSLVTFEHDDLDRAVAEAETDGYTTLVVDRRGRVHGATVVGPRAGETLGELSLAVKMKLSTSAIAGTTHAYPTFSDAVWNAAVANVRERLGQGSVAVAVTVLRAVRRLFTM